MKRQIAGIGLVTGVLLFLELKKALQALQIIPITSEGIEVAAQGGDITPYIIAMIGIVIAVSLPVGAINALTD